jgi:hypothetical protein
MDDNETQGKVAEYWNGRLNIQKYKIPNFTSNQLYVRRFDCTMEGKNVTISVTLHPGSGSACIGFGADVERMARSTATHSPRQNGNDQLLADWFTRAYSDLVDTVWPILKPTASKYIDRQMSSSVARMMENDMNQTLAEMECNGQPSLYDVMMHCFGYKQIYTLSEVRPRPYR